MSRNIGRFRFFPNMYMSLVNLRWVGHKTKATQAVFRISPKMNKLEVREYLTAIYNVPVQKVMTANYLGKKKRIIGSRQVVSYARPDFKHPPKKTLGRKSQAIVTFPRGAQVYTPSQVDPNAPPEEADAKS